MLKVVVIACALCTGAGATMILVKSDSGSDAARNAAVSRSFQDVHANAHLDNLPVRLPGAD